MTHQLEDRDTSYNHDRRHDRPAVRSSVIKLQQSSLLVLHCLQVMPGDALHCIPNSLHAAGLEPFIASYHVYVCVTTGPEAITVLFSLRIPAEWALLLYIALLSLCAHNVPYCCSSYVSVSLFRLSESTTPGNSWRVRKSTGFIMQSIVQASNN